MRLRKLVPILVFCSCCSQLQQRWKWKIGELSHLLTSYMFIVLVRDHNSTPHLLLNIFCTISLVGTSILTFRIDKTLPLFVCLMTNIWWSQHFHRFLVWRQSQSTSQKISETLFSIFPVSPCSTPAAAVSPRPFREPHHSTYGHPITKTKK